MKLVTTKWSIIAAIGLLLSGVGAGALAYSDSAVSMATTTDVADLRLETRGVEAVGPVGRARDPGADSFDPYTCAAAYGDGFCAAFQQCMAKQGFNACYRRTGQ